MQYRIWNGFRTCKVGSIGGYKKKEKEKRVGSIGASQVLISELQDG